MKQRSSLPGMAEQSAEPLPPVGGEWLRGIHKDGAAGECFRFVTNVRETEA